MKKAARPDRSGPVIVTVGDELVFGEQANDNQTWLLQLFTNAGSPPVAALSLPDITGTIGTWLQHVSCTNSGPVIVSGGIGGTHDDCTRAGIAAALEVPLVVHDECFAILAQQYGARFNAQRQRMAALPQGAALIPNPHGAPGFQIHNIHAFPGFPSMLRPMIVAHFADLLKRGTHTKRIVKSYDLPVSEGDIAQVIETFSCDHPECTTGIYPSDTQRGRKVTVRVRCDASHHEAASRFEQLIQPYIDDGGRV